LKQLENARRERVIRLRKLEPLLTAGGDVGAAGVCSLERKRHAPVATPSATQAGR